MAKEPADYVYTKLNDLYVSKKLNFYGIITEVVKNHGVMKNNKLHSIVLLTDESLPANKVFRMHFFLPTSDGALQWKQGQILRLHRVQVEEWNDCLDGRVFSSRGILFIPTDSDPYSTAGTFTFTDKDKARIEELFECMQVKALFKEADCEELLETDSQHITLGTANSLPNNHQSSKPVSEGSTESEGTNSDENAQGFSEELDYSKPTVMLNPLNENFLEILSKQGSMHNNTWKSFVSNTGVQIEKKNASVARGKRKLPPKRSLDVNGVSSSASPEQAGVIGSSPKELRFSSNKSCLETSLEAFTDLTKEPHDNLGSVSATENKVRAKMSNSSGQNQLPNKSTGPPSNNKCKSSPGPFDAGSTICNNEPIILRDDDPRLAGFDEASLITEGEGDIPAADEDGCVISRSRVVHYGGGTEKMQPQVVSILDLLNFQWPEYRAKVRIVKIKPSFEMLHDSSKNLLSGLCGRCCRFTFYKCAKWKCKEGSSTKTALCPLCLKAGQEELLALQFRMKLTVTDSWGTQADMHLFKQDASQFLGTSLQDFLQDDVVRNDIVSLLSEIVTSRCYLMLRFCRLISPVKPVYHIKNCILRDIMIAS